MYLIKCLKIGNWHEVFYIIIKVLKNFNNKLSYVAKYMYNKEILIYHENSVEKQKQMND